MHRPDPLRPDVPRPWFGVPRSLRSARDDGSWRTRRTLRFRERMDLANLSVRRRVPPAGVDGGELGQVGRNRVRRRDGRLGVLAGCDQTVLEPGEAITVETPTGAGLGERSA